MNIRAVKFRVGAENRIGALYYPSHAGRFPAVLFLHGFPGVQKNDDIAAELCRRGMVCLVPHIRGCWGSAGSFTVSGLLEDAKAAHRLLCRYRLVDARRVAVVGTSLGGWAALRLAASRPLAATVALAPAVELDRSPETGSYVRKNARVVSHPPLAELIDDYVKAVGGLPPERYAGWISPCPLLLVQGSKDTLVDPAATHRLFASAQEPKELVEFENEEHDFQRDRASVVRVVSGWLERKLASAMRVPS